MPSALEKLRDIRSVPAHLPQEEALGGAAGASTEYIELQAAPTLPAVSVRPPFDPAASAALRLVAFAPGPLPHPQIVRALAEQGYSKPEAYKAVAHCQGRGWIEHNLISGYVLAECNAAGTQDDGEAIK